ncbi:hypothetical protein pipiens_016650 [Culex pipiens pipiens]|uniref:Uncharacterized protein n=1 Tax=Culex pipiens pipiens TaxID=38569 RepID=A0ABD1CKD4_CULPP
MSYKLLPSTQRDDDVVFHRIRIRAMKPEVKPKQDRTENDRGEFVVNCGNAPEDGQRGDNAQLPICENQALKSGMVQVKVNSLVSAKVT